MGWNLGIMAGAAADGYRKQNDEMRKAEGADFEKKKREREEGAWKEEDTWKQERKAYKTKQQKYQEDLSEYEKRRAEAEAAAKANGGNPQAAGIAPMQIPQAPQAPGLHDELGDMVNLARIDVQHGRANATTLLPLLQGMRQMEEEGMTKALQQAAMGDREGALKTFSSTGSMRDVNGITFEDSTFEPGNGGKPIKSVNVVLPDGRKLDAVGTLWQQQQAKDLLGNYFRQANLENDNKRTDATIKHQDETRAEDRRAHMANEGIARTKAAEGAESTTAEIKNINFLIKNGIAKDPKQAWDMVKTGKTPAGEHVVSDGRGGVMVIDRDNGQVSKIDRRGNEKIMRQPRSAGNADTEAPPVAGAKKSPKDGKWYVNQGGKWFLVE